MRAGLDQDGNFTREAMDGALAAIRRFNRGRQAIDVPLIDARDGGHAAGENGSELIDAIRAETGLEPRFITGEDEVYCSRRMISGFFQPRGLVGDIGGGSLEAAEVLGARPLACLPAPPSLTAPLFSAFGLREGWLYQHLEEQERYRDPLLEGTLRIGLPVARVPHSNEALGRWTDDLLPGETQNERRVRLAVCAPPTSRGATTRRCERARVSCASWSSLHRDHPFRACISQRRHHGALRRKGG